MSKKYNIILSCIFSVFLLLLFWGNIFFPKKAFSETENRYLAQMPSITLKSILEGSFSKAFENYIQDQFLGRDFFVTLKNEIEVLLNKTDNNGTYIGLDNWYFEKKDIANTEKLEENVATINNFSSWAKENNLIVNFLPIYSSFSIYPEKMPSNADVFNEKEAFTYITNNIADNVQIIDIYDSLIEHKSEYIYFKTDHHWTQRGAYYAYQKIAEDFHWELQSLNSMDVNFIDGNFWGSLYSKAPLWSAQPDNIEVFESLCSKDKFTIEYFDTAVTDNCFYVWDNFNKKDKYTVFLGGNNSLVTIKNNSCNNDKKLLMLKDSFSHTLIPFLAEYYSEIHVVDLRYFTRSIRKYIVDNKITDTFLSYNISWFADDTYIRLLKF